MLQHQPSLRMPTISHGYIIAIDPGVTTGVCVMLYTGKGQYSLIESRIICWDYRYIRIKELFDYDPIVALIYEKFRLFPDEDGEGGKQYSRGQAYSEFEAVQVSEILCTNAWYHSKQHLLVPLPPSVKGSSKPGGIKVQIRDCDVIVVNEAADNAKDREHAKDAYQLNRWWITQQIKATRGRV